MKNYIKEYLQSELNEPSISYQAPPENPDHSLYWQQPREYLATHALAHFSTKLAQVWYMWIAESCSCIVIEQVCTDALGKIYLMVLKRGCLAVGGGCGLRQWQVYSMHFLESFLVF